jgi:MATE family multidrug resistance protein
MTDAQDFDANAATLNQPIRWTPEPPDSETRSSMSAGRILRELLVLAVPLMLGNLFVSLQLLIDRVMLSHWHPEAPGAVLAAGTIAWTVIVLVQTTAGFTVTFVAQYTGAGRPREIGPYVWQGFWIALAGGLGALIMVPFAGPLVGLAGHDARLRGWETEYLRFIVATAGPVAIQAAFTGFFSGRGQTWIVILLNAIGCAANACLDWILIFGRFGFPELGVFGAGMATLIGCLVPAGLAMALVTIPATHETQFRTRSGWRPDSRRLFRLLNFGLPNGLQAQAEVLVWAAFVILVGRIGSAELSATSIVFNINALFFIPMLGLGQASGVFVGQRLGEERPALAERGVRIGALVTIAFMGSMGLLAAVSPGPILHLFQPGEPGPEWVRVASLIPTLIWFVAIYSVFDGLNVLLSFSLRGAGDTRFVSVLYVVAGLGLLVLPTWLVCKPGSGLVAAWTVATAYLLTLTGIIAARFQFGPWRTMRVIEPSVVDDAP